MATRATKRSARSALCVALDFSDPGRCRAVAREVSERAGRLKL